MNKKLNSVKLEILKNFERQGDFAAAVNVHESFVSQVLRGRRKLNKEQALKWQRLLGCDARVLKVVKRDENS